MKLKEKEKEKERHDIGTIFFFGKRNNWKPLIISARQTYFPKEEFKLLSSSMKHAFV